MPKFHLTLKGTHTRGWGGASEEAVQQWYGGPVRAVEIATDAARPCMAFVVDT